MNEGTTRHVAAASPERARMTTHPLLPSVVESCPQTARARAALRLDPCPCRSYEQAVQQGSRSGTSEHWR
jgi:hypothetical protein